MNQQRPQQNRPTGGSVKRARERAEAGEPSVMPLPGQKAFIAPRLADPNAPTNRMQPQMAPPAVPRGGQVPIGVAISQAVQAAQWPLAGSIEGGPAKYQPPQNRGPPPQRPSRPSQVPSMIDTARLAENSPDCRYVQRGGRYEEEDQFSPELASPMTQSSRPSTLSSVGTIPDFPVPVQANGPPRKSPYLGPPPSSRRGASSYYSQASFVSPIPEESPRPSHQSYASSAAIPTSWGSDSPRGVDSPRTPYDENEYEDESVHEDDSRFYNEPAEERGESRESTGDDSDDRGLIRSASFGRRAKPSMITTKGSDRIGPVRPGPIPQQNMSKLEKMGFGAEVGGAAGALAALRTRDAQREPVWPLVDEKSENPLASGTGFIDASISSSEETLPSIAKAVTVNEPEPAFTPKPSEQKTNAMLGAYNAASSLQPVLTPLRTPSPGFSRLSAIRRPPRLDMDAVRDAEARGSLTSLPDLIARATKLAAMMDRGKRPGSRNALNDFTSDSDFAMDKETGMSANERHKSGLSGMLAAFPPPGIQTPQNGTPTRPMSTWPSGYDPATGLGGQEKGPKKPRRCCGLPAWGFLLVLLLLLVAAAAAVVVPLEFLVFHKAKTSTPNALSAIQQCEADTATACKNGGASLIDNGSCACICTNGFMGSTCTSANGTGCVTTALSGLSSMNVTVGDSISRLISDAQSNFSIPLSASTIVVRFNSNNLSCATENALVTFDGESTRIGNRSDVVNVAATTSVVVASATGTAAKLRRHASKTTTSSQSAVATSTGGIIYDNSSPPSTATSSSSSSTQTSLSPSGIFSITEEVLDFARVAVLYILQQENLEQATNAQGTLQHFFSLESFTNAAAQNVSVGGNIFVNLVGFSVNIGNRSVGAANSSLTKRTSWGENVRLWDTPL